MEPTPSPTPVEVFVHTGPAEWWEVLAALGPLAVLLGALIAGVVGWRTLQQKAEADNRSEWWKRAQWALDAVHSGDKQRGAVGLKVLRVLGESELAGTGELAVLQAATERPLGRAARQARPGARAAPSPAGSESDFDDDDRALHIAAAQLREVTDRRLGRTTPAWIRALGEEQP